MVTQINEKRTFSSELRSLVLTAQCLAEYAAEQGDRQCAAILANVADLLALTVAKQGGHDAITPQETVAA